MTAKDAIRFTIDMGQEILTAYLSDLTDADLLVRVVPEANHAAWQLGHVIASEHEMLTGAGFAMPGLPDGFAEAHSKETAGSDGPAGFLKKDEYLALAADQRAATLEALANVPDADLDRPSPEPMREYAPTIGAMFNVVGVHVMMHACQLVPLRRKLGRSVLI